jgi:hypothetical protein
LGDSWSIPGAGFIPSPFPEETASFIVAIGQDV